MSGVNNQGHFENTMHSDEVTDLLAKFSPEVISGVTDGTPATEKAFTHTLGRIPKGFIITTQDKAGSFYAGATANTATTIYLSNSVATVAFTAFVF